MARILVVEDEAVLRGNIADRLRVEGHEVFDAGAAETGLELATLLAPVVVLTDLRLPGMDGLAMLREIRRISPRTLVVVITAHGTRQTAIDAVREGAYDYLLKPVELKELVLLVDRAVTHARTLDRMQYVRDAQRRAGGLEQIVGVSAAIRGLKNRLRELAASPLLRGDDPPPLLITGETGVGKTLLAHAVHNEGPRRHAPIVHVHCARAGDDAFECELFGRLAGRGTDASPERTGLFEIAEGGTLFLDEIGQLSPAMQVRLVAALEQHAVQPLGAGSARRFNVHVIAATHRALDEGVRDGWFRPDLYHRLRAHAWHVPPLRERPEDLPPLAERFVALHAGRLGVDPPALAESVHGAMSQYGWPGNVRELSHVIERALLVCRGGNLTETDLALPLVSAPPTAGVLLPSGECIALDFESDGLTLADVEARVIRAAYAHTGGDLARTARILGLSPEALAARLKRM